MLQCGGHEKQRVVGSEVMRTLNPHASFSNGSYPGMSGSRAMLMKNPSICWLSRDPVSRGFGREGRRNAPEAHVQAPQVGKSSYAKVEVQNMVVRARQHLPEQRRL